MARVSLGDKATRVLKMIIGLRNKRALAAMAGFGFTDSDLQEGWKLLQALNMQKIEAPISSASVDTIDKLDSWENRWFPIAEATLANRHPAVHAVMFNNLSQTSGPAVAISVRTFIDRFDAIVAGTSSVGLEGQTAEALLETRGLTKPVIDEARAMLDSLGKFDISDTNTIESDKADLAKAEEDLWAWYLEWSQIARIAIKQKALLRGMGFGGSRGGSDKEIHADVDPVTGVIVPVQGPTG